MRTVTMEEARKCAEDSKAFGPPLKKALAPVYDAAKANDAVTGFALCLVGIALRQMVKAIGLANTRIVLTDLFLDLETGEASL